MGTIQVLFIFLGHFISAQSFRRQEDAMLPQDFGGFFDNNWLFHFDRNFDFPGLDTVFSSWRSWNPDFHMLPEFPPVTSVPRVQVFCDETKLTLLVDKKTFGLMLTVDDIQLGDGCYSNKELPNQFVFVYALDQCGTTPLLQDGLQVFTNSLHLNPKKMFPIWWQTPKTIHISCFPKRLYTDPNLIAPPVNTKRFDIQAMNPSWTNPAESNIYERGQVVNLQVSAKTRPDQQLYIYSCFVSSSSESQTKPRHPVILNKGCAASVGSQHAVAQFAATKRADMVNVVVNTTHLISEFYVHCSVVLSTPGVTSASKFCNYNVNKSRWEELNGNVKVCDCCSSKCKGPSVKNLPDDTKALVSIGPLVVVDYNWELSPLLPESKPQTFSLLSPTTMMSDAPSPAEDVIVSAASLSQSELQSSPQGVVMVRQDPDARLTLWLPGMVQAEPDKAVSQSGDLLVSSSQSDDVNDHEQLSGTEEKSSPNFPSTEIPGPTPKNKGDSLLWDMKLVTLIDGWPSPSQNNDVLEGVFPMRNKFRRSGTLDTDATRADSSLPAEINVPVNLMLADKSKAPEGVEEEESQTKQSPTDLDETNMRDELSQMQMDAAVEHEVDVQPIIRTKLEFSKGADGSKKLSYEEEVKQKEMKLPQGTQEPRLKGQFSTFLNLLRRMDKAE